MRVLLSAEKSARKRFHRQAERRICRAHCGRSRRPAYLRKLRAIPVVFGKLAKAGDAREIRPGCHELLLSAAHKKILRGKSPPRKIYYIADISLCKGINVTKTGSLLALQSIHVRAPRAHQRQLLAYGFHLVARYLGAEDTLLGVRARYDVAPGVDYDGVGVADIAAVLVPGRAQPRA